MGMIKKKQYKLSWFGKKESLPEANATEGFQAENKYGYLTISFSME